MPDQTVDLLPEAVSEDGARLTPTDDGGVEVDFDPQQAPQQNPSLASHGENLAKHLDKAVLDKIATKVIEWVAADDQARAPWWDRLNDGFKAVGIFANPDVRPPFPGASKVTHPLLIEAGVQFQGRALEELFPAKGPVKTGVVGDQNPDVMAQSQRVEEHMNYQITVEDNGYFWDVDSMLFYLPFAGSAFKKSWYDTAAQMVKSRFIKAEKLLVPYEAPSLEDASRVTHIMKKSGNDMRRLQISGLYIDIELQQPAQGAETPTDQLLSKADDRQQSEVEDDPPHTIYECHCEYVIDGTPEGGDSGTKRRLAFPYIITVDKDSQKTLAIYRNWKDDDPLCRKRNWFTHYKFLPGLGFYGWGFFHCIPGLGQAATGALRAILDGAATSSLQGGFKSKDLSMAAGEIEIEPGRWKDVEASSEELAKGFYTPPFKEPSATLFQVLGLLVEAGQRFAGTTEVMVGDAPNNAPVGTTVALIEQGSKTFSQIHKRLHRAAGEEFRLRAELNGENLPERYPYIAGGGDKVVLRADYDKRVDVIPVSDPNIFSSTQRIAIAQTVLQVVMGDQAFFEKPQKAEAYRRMFEALRTPNYEMLLPKPDEPPPPMDPVTEGVMLMTGQPVKAYVEQAHKAHNEAHKGQLAQLKGSPIEQAVAPAIIAHMAEHYAMDYKVEMMQLMQLQTLPGEGGQPAQPAVMMHIAMLAARATPHLPPPPDPDAEKESQKIQQQCDQKLQAADKQVMEIKQEAHDAIMAAQNKCAQDIARIEQQTFKAVQDLKLKADDRVLAITDKANAIKADRASAKEVANINADADIRKAEKIAQINKEAKREEAEIAKATAIEVAKINAAAADEVSKVKDDVKKQIEAHSEKVTKVHEDVKTKLKEHSDNTKKTIDDHAAKVDKKFSDGEKKAMGEKAKAAEKQAATAPAPAPNISIGPIIIEPGDETKEITLTRPDGKQVSVKSTTKTKDKK